MVSTEAGTVTGISPQDVENPLRMQFPMVIPKEIRDLELAGQLPPGDIAYFDVSDPDQRLRFVDRKTWKPVKTRRGIEKRINPDRAPKTFAGIILHTPPRTPENFYGEEIQRLSSLLRRKAPEDDNGLTIEQQLGTLFIVEDRGEDTGIGWRQDTLSIKGKKGLVVDTSHEGSVVITDSHIISFARRQRQYPTISLANGEISGNMVPPFVDEIQRIANAIGLTANTTELEQNWHATKNVIETLTAVKDGNGVTFEGMDNNGRPIVITVSLKGITTITNKEGLLELIEQQKLAQQRAQDKKPTEIEHKPGDTAVREDLVCDACGNHPKDIYERQVGNIRWMLFKKTVCNEAHRDGYPRTFGKRQYIRALEFLPKEMQKPRK